ncbi:MAG TPA: hypothetical protein VFW39_10845 [Sphingomicrobium sp.]|nr:hypothetical protein [Sphingomicrobium sp.]
MKTLLMIGAAAALALTGAASAKPGHGHGHGGYGVGGCPPGLAKKGCIPPGQAKKLYRGQRWQSGFGTYYSYSRIPYDLRRRYRLSDRYRYYYRGGTIYVVNPRTMLIAQVISALLH